MAPETPQTPEDNQGPQVLIFADGLRCDRSAGEIPLPSGIAMRIDQTGTTYQIPSPFRGDPDIVIHTENPRLIDPSEQKSTVSRAVESVRDFFRKILNLNA